jgi:DNA (cytosine-5)-methyltransferase 1
LKNVAHHLGVVSLYTGAGGLDLGLEAAGFHHLLCIEKDGDCRSTLAANRPHWKLADPSDIYDIKPAEILRQAGLKPRQLTMLAGGPPCQPFSKAAYWSNGDSSRLRDPRSLTLRAFMRVVEASLPRVFLIENVKGFAFSGKDEGVKSIQRAVARINGKYKTKYSLQVMHLNAADYGVPQIRERIFLIANIDGKLLSVPPRTHGSSDDLRPYSTVWDAIGDLDNEDFPSSLIPKGKWAGLLSSVPEGFNYLWHTSRNQEKGGKPLFGWRTRYWSFLLKLAKRQPAWTIQAQPGPATGPFHWRNRLLSIAELSRLQTFPIDYTIEGTRQSAQRQIGNAVPSAVGELLGLEIRRQFFGEKVRRSLRLIPQRRSGCPPTEQVSSVPPKYLEFSGDVAAHPGPGLGPGARRRRALAKAENRPNGR